jgi:hypothetical protein
LDGKLKGKLIEEKVKAITRAKGLAANSNPSTLVYEFVGELDKIAT